MCSSTQLSLYQIIKPSFINNLYEKKIKTAVSDAEKCEVFELKQIGICRTAIKMYIFICVIFITIAAFYSIIPNMIASLIITTAIYHPVFITPLRILKDCKLIYNIRIQYTKTLSASSNILTKEQLSKALDEHDLLLKKNLLKYKKMFSSYSQEEQNSLSPLKSVLWA